MTWIEHKGKQILFSDYSNLGAEELIAVVREADATFSEYQHNPPGSLLTLVDFENSVASKEVVNTLKTSAMLWRPLYKKQAVVGLEPLHNVFLRAVNKFTDLEFLPFKTRKAALDWLVLD